LTWAHSHLAFRQDAQLRYTWAFAPVAGPDLEHLIGRSDQEVFPERVAARLTSLKHKARTEGPLQAEIALGEGDDRRVYELVLAPDGEAGIRGSMVDVTTRVRQREQAVATARDFRSILESDWLNIIVLSPDRRVRLASAGARRAAQHLIGAPLALGMVMDRLLPEARRETFRTQVQQALGGVPVEADLTLIGPDGPRHFHYGFGATRNSLGEITGVLLLALETTALRQALEAQEESLRQLRHSQRLESLGLLAAGVAHDFNNLLVSVLSNTDTVLGDELLPEPLREPLEDVKTGAQRAADLTRQLLAYAGKSKPTIERVDLNRLVTEMVQLLRVSMFKGARLTLELDTDLPTIEADRAQVQQIVMNLVTNASEAVGLEGAVRISTRTAFHPTPPDGTLFQGPWVASNFVVLVVEDSGPGIPPEVQGRIFDPFFTTKFSGRGLGLSSVLGIVHAHQGGIVVESGPNTGTKMKVLLPFSQRLPESTPPPILEASPGAARILVVDDDPGVRRALTRQLKRLGHEAELVDNGVSALARLASQPEVFRVVVLDRTMPGMSGEEVLKEIRAQYPNLKVLLISGLAAPSHAPGVPQPDAFLPKPFTITDLGERLLELLSESGRGPGPAAGR
jgi:two-component system cell cycle sensor histidine kinase/response regulator CckA